MVRAEANGTVEGIDFQSDRLVATLEKSRVTMGCLNSSIRSNSAAAIYFLASLAAAASLRHRAEHLQGRLSAFTVEQQLTFLTKPSMPGQTAVRTLSSKPKSAPD